MTTAAALKDGALWRALAEALEPAGFQAHVSRRLFVRARAACICDVVGLRTGRTATGEFAVFFSVWVPEVDQLVPDPAANPAGQIKSFVGMCELSPVAPLKNTGWWPAEGLDAAQRLSLTRQLQELALPYFDTLVRPADVLQMLKGRLDEASQQTADRLQARPVVDEPSPYQASAWAKRVVAALLTAGLGDAGFQAAGTLLWRLRQGVIDLVVPELLADARYVAVHLAVWHQSLTEGIDGDIPQGVTLVTARPVGRHGLDGEPLDALWSTQDRGAIGASLANMGHHVAAQATPFFGGVRTRADVLHRIPAAYRSHFPAA